MELKKHAYHIAELKKHGEYHEAIDYFKSVIFGKFPKNEIANDIWLIANIMFCLRKIGQYQAAMRFPAFLQTNINFLNAGILQSEFGWNLYFYIKEQSRNETFNTLPIAQNLIETGLLILKQQQNQQNKVLQTRLLFEMIRYEQSKQNPDYQYIVELCQTTSEKKLSAQPVYFETKNKRKKLPSELEQWILAYSKALFMCSKHADCIENCNRIMDNYQAKIDRGTQGWLLRRKSLSQTETGEYNLALTSLNEAISLNENWFMYHEKGKIIEKMHDKYQALCCFMLGALTVGESKNKIKLYEDIARLSNELKMTNLAIHHYALALKIRKQNQWKIPQNIANFENEALHVNIGEIRNMWINELLRAGIMHEGYIERILNRGRNGDGFIQSIDNRKVYFKNRLIKRNQELKTGLSVYFIMKENTHKGRKVFQATFVEIPSQNL